MPTDKECKRILFNLGIKLGVSPNLIATRLLNEHDKVDMMDGLLTLESLETNIEVWQGNGMPDYAHGLTDKYKPSVELPMARYRGNGR